MPEIRYLRNDEKYRTRRLYEESFPEDSSSFIDFYYSRKMKTNAVLAAEEDGRIVSMAHLNPYHVFVRGRQYEIPYIVAVATDRTMRRRGLMRMILNRLLEDACQRKTPFVFLEPANPAYYTPFGFTFISEKQPLRLKKGILTDRNYDGTEGFSKADAAETAAFVNDLLEKRYDVFCRRDAEYLSLLDGEVSASGGHIKVLKNPEGNLAGLQTFDYADTKEEDSRLLTDESLTEAAGAAEPFIMGRITNLPEFLKTIRLSDSCSGKELLLRLNIADPILEENSGIFTWRIGHEASAARKENPGMHKADSKIPGISIQALAGWLFGRASIGAEGIPESKIETLKAFFDEEI